MKQKQMLETRDSQREMQWFWSVFFFQLRFMIFFAFIFKSFFFSVAAYFFEFHDSIFCNEPSCLFPILK